MAENRCWELTDRDGSELDWEVIPHYPTELEGWAAAREYNCDLEPDDGKYGVRQRDTVCVVDVACQICSDDDPTDEGVGHFDPDTIDDYLRDCGWSATQDGYVCGRCAADLSSADLAWACDGQETIAFADLPVIEIPVETVSVGGGLL